MLTHNIRDVVLLVICRALTELNLTDIRDQSLDRVV